MNYIKQLLSFYDSQVFNPLSSGQIVLWHALMHVNNKCAWTEWFTVANRTLESLTGLTRQGIVNARNGLKQHGFIEFRGNGTKATSYKIINLYDNTMLDILQVTLQDSVQDTLQGCLQDTLQDSVQDTVQSRCTLNKHKHKQKLNIEEEEKECAREVFVNCIGYWQKEVNFNLGTSSIDKLKAWCEEFGEEGDTIVKYGIDVMLEHGGNTIAYLERILKSWLYGKVETLDHAKQFVRREKAKRGNKTIPYQREDIPKVDIPLVEWN